MKPKLDRADIQGNVLLPYGRNTFAMGNLLLFHVEDHGAARDGGSGAARRFLERLLPQITAAELFRSKRTRRWSAPGLASLRPPPPVTVNVAFTHPGLAAFGVPQATLQGFPPEFQQGMRVRAVALHDDLALWDPVWKEEAPNQRIDMLLLLRVNVASALAKVYRLAGVPMPVTGGYHPAAILEQARGLARRRLDQRSLGLIEAGRASGVRVLAGHGPAGDPEAGARLWQTMESLLRTRAQDGVLAEPGDPQGPGDAAQVRHGEQVRYGEYEHFGFFDGIADPVFEGQYPPGMEAEELIGQGRRQQGQWQPLAAGEFLLGYPDEAQEMAAAPVPLSFSRNGTFLVVRKLHQHVARFEQAIHEQLPAFQRWLRQPDGAGEAAAAAPAEPSELEARQLLRAKLVGRWEDGTPLVVAPSYRDWQAFRAEFQRLLAAAERDEGARQELIRFKRRFRDFTFEAADRNGSRCPFTAHVRRSNPRDSGDPRLDEGADEATRRQAGSVLVNRRRILRRGMSYGEPWVPAADRSGADGGGGDDGRERGTLFMALCAGIFRQFEFMQQQWLNYGADFGAGNDVCPISGVLAPADAARGTKVIIAAPEADGRPPFVFRPEPMPVECRGGAYAFVPSLMALRQMAQGLVDPL